MLAGILLLFPRDRANASEILTGFAFAALYMMNPAWAMIGSLPTLLSGSNSLKKLDQMGVAFHQSDTGTGTSTARPAAPLVDKLELTNVRFSYELKTASSTSARSTSSSIAAKSFFLSAATAAARRRSSNC